MGQLLILFNQEKHYLKRMDINNVICTIAVVYSLIGLPVSVILNKWQQEESLNDFYRLMHSTNFDFTWDILQKISDSDDNTKKLFTNLRLYLYDKFRQQLENIIKALEETDDKNHILNSIKEMKKQYEKDIKNNQEDSSSS